MSPHFVSVVGTSTLCPSLALTSVPPVSDGRKVQVGGGLGSASGSFGPNDPAGGQAGPNSWGPFIHPQGTEQRKGAGAGPPVRWLLLREHTGTHGATCQGPSHSLKAL